MIKKYQDIGCYLEFGLENHGHFIVHQIGKIPTKSEKLECILYLGLSLHLIEPLFKGNFLDHHIGVQ